MDKFTGVSDLELVEEVNRRKLADQVATTSVDTDTMVEVCAERGVQFLYGCHWLDIEAEQCRQETSTPIQEFYESPKSDGVPHYSDVKCGRKRSRAATRPSDNLRSKSKR